MSEIIDRVSFEMQRYSVDAVTDGTFRIIDGYTEQVMRDGLTADDEPMDIVDEMNARSAIRAMREPTAAMISVAPIRYHEVTAHGQSVGVLPYWSDGPVDAYRRMIDEALK